MTYLIQNKKNKGLKAFILSGPFIVFVVLLVTAVLFLSFLNPLFVNLSSSFRGLFDDMYLTQYFRSKKSILSENADLKSQNNKLVSENISVKTLIDENTKLNDLLNRVDVSQYIVAKVIQKPGFSPYDVVVVDAGFEQGVSNGSNVFFGNIAIGSVVEVDRHFSKIKLFSSPDNSFIAIVGETGHEVQAKGLGGGGFEIMLPVGLKVELGDTITLPEISSKVFGVVLSIKNEPGDVFQTVNFSLPVSPFAIDFVEIIK